MRLGGHDILFKENVILKYKNLNMRLGGHDILFKENV